MKTETKLRTGEVGEWAAANFLEDRGYTLLDKNWRWGRFGELDLVMVRDSEVLFVEVKTRRSLSAGLPVEAVDARKLVRMKQVGAAWLRDHNHWGLYRFDVIGVYLRPGREPLFEWLQDVGQ